MSQYYSCKEIMGKSVPFPSYAQLQAAREASSKSINPITYDRYETYHYDAKKYSKLDYTASVIVKYGDKIIAPIFMPIVRGMNKVIASLCRMPDAKM